ncbi:MAG: hypothetical protein HY898_19270 [Deltaproteobacteria bacterium]|nr:hypothetical protein [Deltaproteobacteria bacterium]
MSALPPNGWWVSELDDRVAIYGWDWVAGATTLLHGLVTLPTAIWLSGKVVPAAAGWLLVSLFIAGGVGFRIVVDRKGLLLSRTWLGLPLWSRRLPEGTPVGLGHVPHAPEGIDSVSFVALGGQEVGNASNARFIVKAIHKAQQKLGE